MKTAPAVFPNAGVEAWYRRTLQYYVRAMAQDVTREVKAAWSEDPPEHGFAQDAVIARAAGVMVVDAIHRILLLHRKDGQGWAFPAGGCEWGEAPEACAARELGEETGIAVTGPMPLIDRRTTNGVDFYTYWMRVDTALSMPVLNDEHDDWGYFGRADMEVLLLHPGVRATLMATGGGATYSHTAMDAPSRPLRFNRLQAAMDKWGGIWTRKLDNLSVKIAWDFASKNKAATDVAVKRSFKSAGLTVKFKPTKGMKSAFDATVAENVALIKSIPQKYLNDVQQTVWANVMKGSDLKTMSDTLYQKYAISHRRAALIARDQNAKAKAVFENQRRMELGIEEAIWLHSSAGKEPRPTHVAMDRKTYKLKDGMYDSDEGENVWPGQLINCRCTSQAVIEGFE